MDVGSLPLHREVVLVEDRVFAALEQMLLQIVVGQALHLCEALVAATFVYREDEVDVGARSVGFTQSLGWSKCGRPDALFLGNGD